MDELFLDQEDHLRYPDTFNYAYDVLDVMAEQFPKKRAMLWKNDKGLRVDLTFSDFSRLSNQAANVLRQHGIQKGDIIMTSLKTHYEYWYIALAAHKLGAIVTPVHHLLKEDEVVYRMKDVKAVICTGEGETAATVQRAAAHFEGITLFTVRATRDGFLNFSDEVALASDCFARVPTRVNELTFRYFTSGTSGEPKAIFHDHAFTLSHVYSARFLQDITPDSLHFASGDTAWEIVSGTKFYGQWLCGGALFVYEWERFSAEKLLSELEREKVSSLMAQPTVYRQMTDVGMDKYDLSAIRTYCIGGEKLVRDLAETIQAQTGKPLYEAYAQTEAALIACNSRRLGVRDGSVGKILPKYHVELLKEDGTFAAPGEQGEIVILPTNGSRPAGLGFYEGEILKFEQEQIAHTGDIAYKDEDDFLYYLGRADGLIKTKGYRVSPTEIENTLASHPAVRECMVVGVPDRDLGQRIRAVVCLVDGFEK
ncbi:MAG: AMP-binding protein, partial [Evtepia sp.]